MNKFLTLNTLIAKRIVCGVLVALLCVAGLPMFSSPKASAAQLIDRSITMSDSAPSGGTITTGVGSGDNVTYRVSFEAIAAASHSMVIDFCAESPLIEATCTAPTDFDASGAAIVGVTGNVNATDWTDTSTASQVLLQSGNVSGQEIVPGTETFDLTGIVNPSNVDCLALANPREACSFYARITTYANDNQGTYASATAAGNYQDFGGIALTTVSTITITGRVQEQLTFCITKAAHASWTTTNDCSDPVVSTGPNLPAVILGHGSPVELLDANTVDVGTLYSQLSTNATSGAVVKMRNSNTACGGLSSDGGTTCSIPAHNSGSGAGASAMTAGTAAFGMFVAATSNGPGGSGSLTPAAAYYNASHVTVPTDVWYGMDSTTANNNVISAFGSTLADTSVPVYRVNGSYTFAATAALTTPAGIYTANLSMIATGTF
jgi:hypothetical protein